MLQESNALESKKTCSFRNMRPGGETSKTLCSKRLEVGKALAIPRGELFKYRRVNEVGR